jgi:hypothetical protein
MAKAKKATKHTKARAATAGAPYDRAVRVLMKKRKEGAERAALLTLLRNEDAALRKTAAEQTIAGFRQQGWLSGM